MNTETTIQTICANATREFILSRTNLGNKAVKAAWMLALEAAAEFPEQGTQSPAYIRLETMAQWGVVNPQNMLDEINEYRFAGRDGDGL